MTKVDVSLEEWTNLNIIKNELSAHFHKFLCYHNENIQYDKKSAYYMGFNVENNQSTIDFMNQITAFLKNNKPNSIKSSDYSLSPEVLYTLLHHLVQICIHTDPQEVVINPADIDLQSCFAPPNLQLQIDAIKELMYLKDLANTLLPQTKIAKLLEDAISCWEKHTGITTIIPDTKIATIEDIST